MMRLAALAPLSSATAHPDTIRAAFRPSCGSCGTPMRPGSNRIRHADFVCFPQIHAHVPVNDDR